MDGRAPDRQPRTEGRARHLYVHLPFCSHRCGYCDFVTVAGRPDAHDGYVDALLAELDRESHHLAAPLETVFVGGGTPSFTEPLALERLLRRLPAAREVTIEANPESVDAALGETLRGTGVTRVSVGAQSFTPRLLGVLDRAASPDDVRRAVHHLRGAGFDNISLDLLYGIPGESTADLEHDLAEALELEPEHLSCYELEAKPGTRFTHTWGDQLARQADALEEHFEHVVGRLTVAGYRWYETANFCRATSAHDDAGEAGGPALDAPGHARGAIEAAAETPAPPARAEGSNRWSPTRDRAGIADPAGTAGPVGSAGSAGSADRGAIATHTQSAGSEPASHCAGGGGRRGSVVRRDPRDLRAHHNLAIWRGADYLGIGIGAVSTLGAVRRRNAPSLGGYVAALGAGGDPPREVEVLDAATRARERLMLALRLDEPVSLDGLEGVLDRSALERLRSRGLVETDGDTILLTRRGRFLGGGVAADLIDWGGGEGT